MRAGSALAALAVAVALAACGGDDDAADDRAAITATLERLFQAQQDGDAETACTELYVIQEAEEPGAEGEAEKGEAEAEGEEGEGEAEADPGECEAAFESAQELSAREVHDLSTEIGEIELEGDRATAIVHTELTRSDGSPLVQDQPYDLVRTDDGWRVRIADEG